MSEVTSRKSFPLSTFFTFFKKKDSINTKENDYRMRIKKKSDTHQFIYVFYYY